MQWQSRETRDCYIIFGEEKHFNVFKDCTHLSSQPSELQKYTYLLWLYLSPTCMYLFPLFHPLPWRLEKLPSHSVFFERKNTEISRKVVMKLLTTWFSPPAERVEIMVPLTHGIVNPSWPPCGLGSLPCCLVEDWKKLRDLLNIPSNNRGGGRWDLKGSCNDLWLPQESDETS